MAYESPMQQLLNTLKSSKGLKIGLGIFGILIVLWMVITIIPEGSRGLRFNMGKLEQSTLNPGVQFTMPFFQSVEVLSVRPEEIEVDVLVGPEGAITKDNQTVGASTKLFISNNEYKLHYLWQKVGVDKMKSIVYRTLQSAFKQVIGKYTIFDVAANQQMIAGQVEALIKQELKIYPVLVDNFKIINYDWSEQFEKQIERTMAEAQQVKVKQQELLIAEQEAQKQVKQAEAQKTAKVLIAEGNLAAAEINAKAKFKEGEGLQKYYILTASFMQYELEKIRLQNKYEEIKRWDGRYVPANHYGPIPVQTGSLLGPNQ
ncbi:MAG TPA: prohibitin family protein [Candidatus Nanoarchaeia archaeon]|nr:prohibitin family protein [Candidatus Nanoarchaeia archaeon]